MIFDTHAHYDDQQFDIDREILLRSMEEQGVGTIVNASATVESWQKVLKLTEQYPFLYGMIGVHPDEVGALDEARFQEMERLLQEEKMVAVGEIGLDYYWDNESHDIQKKWFIRQLELARKLGLPVNIHSREAAADTMQILKEYGQGMKAIIHCYSYSEEMAEEYVKMGYLLGIGGVVTFKNARKLKEVVQAVPISHLVLETDCPYLAPEPNRGKRNSSIYLQNVAKAIAELKDMTTEEVIQVTEANAKAFYQI